jgi:hypothetical protein
MKRPILLVTLAGAGLAPVEPLFAHGFAGPHMFISTLLIDDPNVVRGIPADVLLSAATQRWWNNARALWTQL